MNENYATPRALLIGTVLFLLFIVALSAAQGLVAGPVLP